MGYEKEGCGFKIEELAEIISQRVLEKITRKYDFIKREKNDYILDFQLENLEGCNLENLFTWSKKNEEFELEILDPVLKDYFEIFLGKSNEKIINKFIEGFKADVIVNLMSSSLDNLLTYMKSHEINNCDLFYENDQFIRELSYYIKKINLDEFDRVQVKLDELDFNISSALNSKLIPFGAYALVNSPKLTDKLFGDILHNINHLQLKWLTRSSPNTQKENSDTSKILWAQTSFEDYVQLLNFSIISQDKTESEKKYNMSLNLYYFNLHTSLVDVYLLSDKLYKKSRLIRFQRQMPNRLYEKLDYTEKYTFKQNLCENIANVLMIKGLLFKNYILKYHMNSDEINNLDFTYFINFLMVKCMEQLKEAIILTHETEMNAQKMPLEIKSDFLILGKLSKISDPYTKLIKKIAGKFIATDYPVYGKNNCIKYEIYHYAYKSIYQMKKQMSEED